MGIALITDPHAIPPSNIKPLSNEFFSPVEITDPSDDRGNPIARHESRFGTPTNFLTAPSHFLRIAK